MFPERVWEAALWVLTEGWDVVLDTLVPFIPREECDVWCCSCWEWTRGNGVRVLTNIVMLWWCWCYSNYKPPGSDVTLPLLCLRSWVPLQYPDEPCETQSGRRRRWKGCSCITCGQTGGHAGGADAGVQAVPVHPEASAHWNNARVCGGGQTGVGPEVI